MDHSSRTTRYNDGEIIATEAQQLFRQVRVSPSETAHNVLLDSYTEFTAPFRGINWTEEGEKMTFPQMAAIRKAGKSLSAYLGEMETPQGILLANLGVTAAITVCHGGKHYAAMVSQVRKDYGDSVIKPICGYRPAGVSIDAQVSTEISEEFLLWNGQKYVDVEPMLIPEKTYTRPDYMPSAVNNPVEGEKENTAFYFHAPTASVQAVKFYGLVLDDTTPWCADHSETGRIGPKDLEAMTPTQREVVETNKHEMAVKAQRDGILFVELDYSNRYVSHGKLTNNVCKLMDGKMVPAPGKYTVYEGLIKADKGSAIITRSNAPLEEVAV